MLLFIILFYLFIADKLSLRTRNYRSCLNEYLGIDRGGYLAGCFSDKLKWCSVEQVCQGSKV